MFGDFAGDADSDLNADWLDYWRSIFKPVSKQDIVEYEKKYKGAAKNKHVKVYI